MLKKLTIILFILFTAAQCTLQKRVYNKGYAVSWNKKFHHQTDKIQKVKSIEERVVQNEQTDSVPELSDSGPLISRKIDFAEAEVSNELPDAVEYPVSRSVSDTVYVEAVHVPTGVAAFGLMVGTFGSVVGGIYLGIEVLFLVAAALFVASLVLSIISIIQFKTNREAYLHNSFGVIALVLDSFVLLAIGAFIALLFIYL